MASVNRVQSLPLPHLAFPPALQRWGEFPSLAQKMPFFTPDAISRGRCKRMEERVTEQKQFLATERCNFLQEKIFLLQNSPYIKIPSLLRASLGLWPFLQVQSGGVCVQGKQLHGSGVCGPPHGDFLVCLQCVPLVEELGGHLCVQTVPVPADIVLPREASWGETGEALPSGTASLPPRSASGPAAHS